MTHLIQKPNYLIIGRYDPEILLKTRPVRSRMQRQLIESLKSRLKLSGFKLPVKNQWDKFIINLPSSFSLRILEQLTHIIVTTFGVEKIYLAHHYQLADLNQLDQLFIHHFKNQVKNKTFGVRVRIHNNPLYTKSKLEAHLGSLIYNISRGVNLTNPDIWLRIWIDRDNLYLINKKITGVSGLPLGSSDKALVLFSGGIDSPVAAWLAARKGLRVSFLLLTQAGQEQFNHVYKLILPFYQKWFYPLTSYFYVFPGLPVSDLINRRIPPRLRTLMFKKILYLIAYHILKKEKIKILITGESLNQVSTQTPSNLAVTQAPLPDDLLIMRPLITYTKVETIKIARQIGSLTFSEKIPEYCVRAPGGSVTRFTYPKMLKSFSFVKEEVQDIIYSQSYQKLNLKQLIKTSSNYLPT